MGTKYGRGSIEQTLGNSTLDTVTSDSRQARQMARRQRMAETIMAEGAVRIEDIVERFSISLMTAHRDLDELASRGFLRKTRGIVSAAPTSLIESSDLYRAARQSAEKRAIADAAAGLIESGQAIFFDDSTTVLQLAPHIAARAPLTAITNSVTMMNALKDMRDLTLLGLGGKFHNWCNAFMGPIDHRGNSAVARRPGLHVILRDHRRQGLSPVRGDGGDEESHVRERRDARSARRPYQVRATRSARHGLFVRIRCHRRR